MPTRKELHGAIHTFSLSNMKNVCMHWHVMSGLGLEKEQKEANQKTNVFHTSCGRKNKLVLSVETLHLLAK